MGYKLFEHTADLGVEVTGASREALYRSAAEAFADILIDPALIDIDEEEPRIARIGGFDDADLFVNFFRELLALWNRERFLAKDCELLEAGPQSITVRLSGGTCKRVLPQLKREIKAATYHRAALHYAGGVWKGRIVFDV